MYKNVVLKMNSLKIALFKFRIRNLADKGFRDERGCAHSSKEQMQLCRTATLSVTERVKALRRKG